VSHAPVLVDVPLEMIGERLRCSQKYAATLLRDVAGVELDEQAGVARIVDSDLARALRVAFADGELRPLEELGARVTHRSAGHHAGYSGRTLGRVNLRQVRETRSAVPA
jgi:hypothetical protein